MNHPMSNHQIGQATHREYEAKFGSRSPGGDRPHQTARRVITPKWVLGVSGVSASVIAVLTLLF